MSRYIFKDAAPAYWQRDLRVMPIRSKSKQPKFDGWPGFIAAAPNDETKQRWLESHGDGNIALLLGTEVAPGFKLVAVDCDDDRFNRLLRASLELNQTARPTAFSGKRGKKGITYFVIVRDTDKVKSTTLRGTPGLGNIDILAAGRYTVLPPSIHPDTGAPYEWIDIPLLDVDLSDLPVVTSQYLKLLSVAIGSEHTLALIQGESTHDAGVASVAKLVAAGATDAEIETFIKALLPEDYSGNSLAELPGWISSAREKGFERPLSNKPSVVADIVAAAGASVVDLFHDGDGTAYVTAQKASRLETIRIMSSVFELWLRHTAHHVLEKPPNGNQIAEAVSIFESAALFEGKQEQVHVRVAGDHQRIEIDLGDAEGRVVSITKDGWKVEGTATHKFIKGAGFLPLPEPVHGGNIRELQTFLNLDERNFLLLLAFLVGALNPRGPYFILIVEGEQGSGKSFFCEIVKRILDPNKAMKTGLPDKVQDLMIQAKDYRVLSFDNTSYLKAEMSDAMCALATGGGYAVRRLYTDGELYVMAYARPYIANGIGGFVTRPDLMERALPPRLMPMRKGARRTEAEMLAEFEGLLPRILGALYSIAAGALRFLPEVDPPRDLRMADAAHFIRAAEEGLGSDFGSMIDAITEAQNEFIVERVNDDVLVMALRGISRPAPFEGYMIDLFDRLHENISKPGIPKSPSALSNQLRRLRPAMAAAGVHVDFVGKDRRGSRIKVWCDRDVGPPKF